MTIRFDKTSHSSTQAGSVEGEGGKSLELPFKPADDDRLQDNETLAGAGDSSALSYRL